MASGDSETTLATFAMTCAKSQYVTDDIPVPRHPAEMTTRVETVDDVEIVRRRLADGRTISDGQVRALLHEIGRLRAKLIALAIAP